MVQRNLLPAQRKNDRRAGRDCSVSGWCNSTRSLDAKQHYNVIQRFGLDCH